MIARFGVETVGSRALRSNLLAVLAIALFAAGCSVCDECRHPASAATPDAAAGEGAPTPAGDAAADPASSSAAFEADSPWRVPGPPLDTTIFSPLNLPTPSTVRTASGLPGPDYWQQKVDYDIDATLDAENKRLTATARVTYTNHSPYELPYLWVHLEQNLFRSDSHGTLSTPPGSRFNNRAGTEGGFELAFLRAYGYDLEYDVHDTLARISLREPVAANGGQFVFDMGWSFAIPDYGADRMGIQSNEQGLVFEMAQWFPAVANFDDVRGWNALPYLGQGEFYTNFGDYDVRLTVPRSHLVVATGVLQNEADVLTPTQVERLATARATTQTTIIRGAEEVADPASRPQGDGPLTWHFQARNVRTFAWASSEAFVWDAAGIDWGDGSPGVLVQSVYPKEAMPVWSDHSTDALRFSIEHYSAKWFRYPYPSATNVNGVCGGMEYPMIIFCGGRGSMEGLFGVTTHEIGHNWFPMVVNTDERRYAWMDEGFNSFVNHYAWMAWNGAREAVAAGEIESTSEFAAHDNVDPQASAQDLGGTLADPDLQPIDVPADQIKPWHLGLLEYGKTAAGLRLLREHILGPERFDKAFRRYVAAWAFKSPQPADFFRCMEDAAGIDLAWFWRGWFLEATHLDQAVTGVTYSDDGATARVTLRNRGRMVMPVTLEVAYLNGTTEDRALPVAVWHYTDEWTTEFPVGEARIASVTVDPDLILPDSDRSNNTWISPDAPPPSPSAEPEPLPAEEADEAIAAQEVEPEAAPLTPPPGSHEHVH